MTPTLFGIICLCAFLVSEFAFRRKGEAKDIAETESDRGTTRQIGLSYFAAVVLFAVSAAFGWPRLPDVYRWVGIAFAVGGIGLRWWSMVVLGRFYTRTLLTTGDQAIVRQGPYRAIRHPGYLGSLFLWIGVSVALAPFVVCVLIAAIFLAAYVRRMAREEEMLCAKFGGAYEGYRAATWRLVPLVY